MSDAIHPEDTFINLPEKEERKGWLTEREIKDCWRSALLAAADCAKALTTVPAQGPEYVKLRMYLALAEGACRQMGWWRDDARWFPLGMMPEQFHQVARGMIGNKYARQGFRVLEGKIRQLVATADELENKRTGRVGMILPEPLADTRTEGRSVQVKNPVELAFGKVKGRA